MRRLRDIHVWLVGYDMVSLSLYHILVLARFISSSSSSSKSIITILFIHLYFIPLLATYSVSLATYYIIIISLGNTNILLLHLLTKQHPKYSIYTLVT